MFPESFYSVHAIFNAAADEEPGRAVALDERFSVAGTGSEWAGSLAHW